MTKSVTKVNNGTNDTVQTWVENEGDDLTVVIQYSDGSSSRIHVTTAEAVLGSLKATLGGLK